MADNKNPLVSFHYAIDISGAVKGYFTECSGIGSEHEVIEHKIVDDSGHQLVQKIPGRLKWDDITLKRGITDSLDIWDWRDLVVQGKVADARKNGTITMFDQELKPVAKWDFVNAWPVKVSGPTVKSDSNEFGVEELIITHEGLTRSM
ncbi:MAG: phage tail protein [Chloroflexi bacterium]|nr:phage tail protein [Chloroflexota bacterium]